MAYLTKTPPSTGSRASQLIQVPRDSMLTGQVETDTTTCIFVPEWKNDVKESSADGYDAGNVSGLTSHTFSRPERDCPPFFYFIILFLSLNGQRQFLSDRN